MADVIIRDIPEDLLERLKARAADSERTLESELKDILGKAALAPPFSQEEAVRQILEFRAKHGPIRTSQPIDELISEDREAR